MANSGLSAFQIRKNYLARRRLELLRQFKKNAEPRLSIEHPHILGGQSSDLYQKESLPLRDGEQLHIITNQNLRHDTTILWQTTGRKLKAALRMGQLRPQALTSKAIKALGKYRKKVMDRKIKSRIESYLKDEKEFLLNLAQDRMEWLQDLERCLAHRIHPDSADSAASEMLGCLDFYILRQDLNDEAIEKYQPLHQEGWKKSFSRACTQVLLENKQESINAAYELRVLIDQNRNDAEWLQTRGYEEILSFIKARLLSISRQTQGLNQVLTQLRGSRAYLRGDLNNYFEDTVEVIREHTQDLHNPVTRDHQLAYEADEELIMDSDVHTNGSSEELQEFMLILSELSGDNSSLNASKGEIKATSATKWRHWRSFYDFSNPYEPSLFSSKEHFFGVLRNLLLAPLNLIETAFRGPEASFIASLRYEAPENNEVTGQSNYYALNYRVKSHASLSTKIGLELYKAVNYLFIEGLAKGLHDGWLAIKHLPREVYTDFQDQEAKLETVFSDLAQELKELSEHDETILRDLASQYPMPEQSEEKEEVHQAEPKIALHPYHSHGLLNGAVNGFNEFVDLIGHNMFAKHPFTATLSSMGAAQSFLAFFATPIATKIFGKTCVSFLQGEGYLWGKDLFSASMAGSFTHFKLIGAIVEGIEHGPDSWLSKGVSNLIEDPAKTITFTALAWAIGYALVYLVDVPWLSEECRKHIGNPPQLSEIFGGAKLGIIAYYLITSPQEQLETVRKNYIKTCVENYVASELKRGRSVSHQDKAKFEKMLEGLISIEAIEKIRHQAQQAAPKLPQEKELSLLLYLATHKEKLFRLSPLMKARLQLCIQKLTASKEDARAVECYLYPEKYEPKSTLRSFLGRAISYLPVVFRCLLSPAAGLWSCTLLSLTRPWKDLGEMLLDDLTSTVQAFSRFSNKILETFFNRLPRTPADVVLNGVFARLASFFGFHGITIFNYRQSARWDQAQEKLYANSTGRVLNSLIRSNTTAHPEVGLNNILEERTQRSLFAGPLKFTKPTSEILPAEQSQSPGIAAYSQSP